MTNPNDLSKYFQSPVAPMPTIKSGQSLWGGYNGPQTRNNMGTPAIGGFPTKPTNLWGGISGPRDMQNPATALPIMPYKSNTGNPYLDNLINQYGNGLTGVTPFSQVLPYETFAKPLQTYIKGVTDTYKPWYEYFTAEPFKQQMAGEVASGGASRTGYAQPVIQRELRQLYQPMQQAIDDIIRQYEQSVITPLYNEQVRQYYQSPITGFDYNLGQNPNVGTTQPVNKGIKLAY